MPEGIYFMRSWNKKDSTLQIITFYWIRLNITNCDISDTLTKYNYTFFLSFRIHDDKMIFKVLNLNTYLV